MVISHTKCTPKNIKKLREQKHTMLEKQCILNSDSSEKQCSYSYHSISHLWMVILIELNLDSWNTKIKSFSINPSWPTIFSYHMQPIKAVWLPPSHSLSLSLSHTNTICFKFIHPVTFWSSKIRWSKYRQVGTSKKVQKRVKKVTKKKKRKEKWFLPPSHPTTFEEGWLGEGVVE